MLVKLPTTGYATITAAKTADSELVLARPLAALMLITVQLNPPPADSHSRTGLILTLKKKSILQSNKRCISHAEDKHNGRRIV